MAADALVFRKIPKHIMVVEDDSPDAILVSKKVNSLWPECKITSVRTMKEARRVYKGAKIDAVLLDLNLPDSMGPKTVRDARSFIDVPIIVMTGMAPDITIEEAMKHGARVVVPKRDLIEDDFLKTLEAHASDS